MKCNASYFSVETLSMADNNTQPQTLIPPCSHRGSYAKVQKPRLKSDIYYAFDVP